MRSTTSDIIIIGGGCSGLALAYALSKASCHLSIRILESRSHYSNDRTWCFWTKAKNEWTELACQRWNKWSFQLGDEGKPVVHQGQDWFYYCLAAKDYYHFVQQSLLHNYHIKLEMNQTITEVQYADPEQPFSGAKPEAMVKTQAGNTYQAKLIIDTRQPVDRQSMLYQSFFGIEIKTNEASPDIVSLMHNLRADNDGVRFNYILPLTPNRVLFEHTRFSQNPIDKQSMEAQCQDEMRRIKCQYKAIFRKEYGCLPMGMDQSNIPYYSAGTAGGALRDASGYGFLRIQSWAERIASKLSQPEITLPLNQLMADKPEGKEWITWLDMLFLKTIKNNPSDSASYFFRLAKNLNSQQFMRFMTDSPSKMDLLFIVHALPKWPFLKQLFSEHTQKQSSEYA